MLCAKRRFSVHLLKYPILVPETLLRSVNISPARHHRVCAHKAAQFIVTSEPRSTQNYKRCFGSLRTSSKLNNGRYLSDQAFHSQVKYSVRNHTYQNERPQNKMSSSNSLQVESLPFTDKGGHYEPQTQKPSDVALDIQKRASQLNSHERPRVATVEFIRDNVVSKSKSSFFDKIKAASADGGAQNLFFVADFDHTLSMPACLTSWSIIDSSTNTPSTFRAAAARLVTKYYPTELDSSLTPQQKSPILTEWFQKFHQLIVDTKITPEARSAIIKKALKYPPASQSLSLCIPKHIMEENDNEVQESELSLSRASSSEDVTPEERRPDPFAPLQSKPKFKLVTAAGPLAPQIPSLTLSVYSRVKEENGVSDRTPFPEPLSQQSQATPSSEQNPLLRAGDVRAQELRALDTYSSSNSEDANDYEYTSPNSEASEKLEASEEAARMAALRKVAVAHTISSLGSIDKSESKEDALVQPGHMVLPTYPTSTSALEMRRDFGELFTILFFYKIPAAVVSAGLGNFIQACLAHNGIPRVFPLLLQPASVSQISKLPDDVVFLVANMLETDASRGRISNGSQDLSVESVVSDDYNKGEWIGYSPADPIHVYRKCASAELAKLQLALIDRQRRKTDNESLTSVDTNTFKEFTDDLQLIENGTIPTGCTFGDATCNPQRKDGQTVIVVGDSLGDLTIPGSLPFSSRVLSIGFFNTPLFYPTSYFTDDEPPLSISHVPTCPKSADAISKTETEEVKEQAKTTMQAVAQTDTAHCEACTILRLRSRFMTYLDKYDVVILGEKSLGFVSDTIRCIAEGIDPEA